MASVPLSACARDGHVPEDVDEDRLCGVMAAAFNDRDAALLSEVARQFRVERSRLRLDADGVYVPQSRFFVEERGIYVAKPGAVLPKASDPSFTPVRLCVYRYRIAG